MRALVVGNKINGPKALFRDYYPNANFTEVLIGNVYSDNAMGLAFCGIDDRIIVFSDEEETITLNNTAQCDKVVFACTVSLTDDNVIGKVVISAEQILGEAVIGSGSIEFNNDVGSSELTKVARSTITVPKYTDSAIGPRPTQTGDLTFPFLAWQPATAESNEQMQCHIALNCDFSSTYSPTMIKAGWTTGVGTNDWFVDPFEGGMANITTSGFQSVNELISEVLPDERFLTEKTAKSMFVRV